LRPATCPNCGANLRLPDGLQRAFCTYCGSEVIISESAGKAEVQCPSCNGYGRVDICRVCDGSGHCTWFMARSSISPDTILIGPDSHCDNGICSACGGSGSFGPMGCPFCGGTGKCPRCLGTGKCVMCRGVGLIPNPQGIQMCVACGGTGLTEPGAPNAIEAGLMCPECKRPMAKGSSYCKHCGYKVNRCPRCGAVWITGTLVCSKCGFSPDSPHND
jgi:DNA-directed RNA polymerase subunit RPC12/RpoP